jgi:hypothetical protein
MESLHYRKSDSAMFNFIAKTCLFLCINTLYIIMQLWLVMWTYIWMTDDLQLAEIEIMIAEQKRYHIW